MLVALKYPFYFTDSNFGILGQENDIEIDQKKKVFKTSVINIETLKNIFRGVETLIFMAASLMILNGDWTGKEGFIVLGIICFLVQNTK